MIVFDRFQLSNGLRVIVHQDSSTPMVAFNLLYDVGARDEDPEKTGFAHLFEHLMFGGSVNVPSYDEPLQKAGGENNAYTTNDITNYYIQLPKANMETAFWLESDRMLSLAFSESSLEVQRKVVSEEFKEHYINKPYGDAWKHLRSLAYQRHPYQWLTIGKTLSHIEEAKMEEVKAFFQKHYNPANAILCVAGPVQKDVVKTMAEKWFGNIPSGKKYERQLPKEPEQTEARFLEVVADVPLNALYKAWPIPPRLSPKYYACDLITEILGSGYSSRLHQRLVKEQELFVGIGCYHTGSLDAGLLVVEGKVRDGVPLEKANAAVEEEIERFITTSIEDTELNKVKNKIESMIAFEDMSLLNRANNLAFFELLGDAEMMNHEWNHYNDISAETLQESAAQFLQKQRCNTLFYRKKK